MVRTLCETRFSDDCSTAGMVACGAIGGLATSATSVSLAGAEVACRSLSRCWSCDAGIGFAGEMAVSARYLRMSANGLRA